jgi:hypothetical protein
VPTRSHKINLGVGIYKDETGATPILHCVEAEQKLLTDEKTKNYLGIEGNIEYGRIVQQLLFGRDAALVTSGRQDGAGAGRYRCPAHRRRVRGTQQSRQDHLDLRSHLGEPRQRVPGGRFDRPAASTTTPPPRARLRRHAGLPV